MNQCIKCAILCLSSIRTLTIICCLSVRRLHVRDERTAGRTGPVSADRDAHSQGLYAWVPYRCQALQQGKHAHAAIRLRQLQEEQSQGIAA